MPQSDFVLMILLLTDYGLCCTSYLKLLVLLVSCSRESSCKPNFRTQVYKSFQRIITSIYYSFVLHLLCTFYWQCFYYLLFEDCIETIVSLSAWGLGVLVLEMFSRHFLGLLCRGWNCLCRNYPHFKFWKFFISFWMF